jgi:hypothetical protein
LQLHHQLTVNDLLVRQYAVSMSQQFSHWDVLHKSFFWAVAVVSWLAMQMGQQM